MRTPEIGVNIAECQYNGGLMISYPAIRYFIGVIATMSIWLPNMSAQNMSETSRFVEANTRFSFKLFHQLVVQTPDKNVLVSPIGLSLTFALLDNGADPGTREEIENAFGFKGLDLTQINEGAKTLRENLRLSTPIGRNAKKPVGITPQQWHALRSTPPEGTVIADSLWLNRISFPESFMKVNREYYGVDVKRLLTAPSSSAQINQWAIQRTRRTLSISPGEMSKNDFLFVEVTYFNEAWKDHFPESATKPATFTSSNGSSKQLPFMYQTRHFQYFEDEMFQAVILPYLYQRAMFIFLPKEASSLADFEQVLNEKQWTSWLSKFDSREGTVGLPRFQMESGFDVRAALKELGVDRVFDTFAAFRPIVPLDGARLENAIQKTQLKVDERGTQAVSIGLMGGVIGGVAGGMLGGPLPPPPFKMIMNRPFFLAIVDQPTGQLLFLGSVMEP
jgi:serine protease inhibitor